MSSTQLFCPNCRSYFPAWLRCRGCGFQRSPLGAPTRPGEAAWSAQVGGAAAFRLAQANLKDEPVVLVAWNVRPQPGKAGSPESGVTVLRLSDGGVAWTARFQAALEGGVCVAGALVLCALKLPTLGAGQGWLAALDLETGAERWRCALGGMARGLAAADSFHAYVGASDGQVTCLQLATGRPLWSAAIYPEPAHILAAPVVVREHGIFQALIVASFGGLQGWKSGRLSALDEHGKKLWEHDAGGNVRGAPVVSDGVVYYTAFQSSPSLGVVNALDARTGRPRWPQPFELRAPAGSKLSYGFAGGPLLHQGRLYAAALNQRLYTFSAEHGGLIHETPLRGPAAVTPVVLEDLVAAATNNGYLCAVDTANGELAWDHRLAGAGLSDPLVYEDFVVAADESGAVRAVPWHNGSYKWAAQRLEQRERFAEAGDLRALQAHFSQLRADSDQAYTLAETNWLRAGLPERVGSLWVALDRREKAAEAYFEAGERYRMFDAPRASGYFYRAAGLYFLLHRMEQLEKCTRALALCADLPYILLQPVNVGNFIQWQEGEFTLRLINDSQYKAPSTVRLWMGGALKSAQEATISSPLAPGQTWNIPLRITPTRLHSALEVELEYDTGDPVYPVQRGTLSIPIEAVEPPVQPPNIHIGDVGMIQLSIGGTTVEGLKIVTRDVGVMRSSGEIGSVAAGGDIGALSARGPIDQVKAGGDIGVVRAGGETGPVTAGGDIGAVSARGPIDQVNAGGDIGIVRSHGDPPPAVSPGQSSGPAAPGPCPRCAAARERGLAFCDKCGQRVEPAGE